MSDPGARSSRRARVARVAVEGMLAAFTVAACRAGAPASAPQVVVARVQPADAGAAWSPPTEPGVEVEAPPKPRDCCRGRLGGCRGDDHDCRGKNECKGLGTACVPDDGPRDDEDDD